MLARGHDVSIIDTDIEMIDMARQFDFKAYYGDGTRLDILHAAGTERAGVVLVCVDGAEAAIQIVELVKSHFLRAPVLARDRQRFDLEMEGGQYAARALFSGSVGKAMIDLDKRPDREP